MGTKLKCNKHVSLVQFPCSIYHADASQYFGCVRIRLEVINTAWALCRHALESVRFNSLACEDCSLVTDLRSIMECQCMECVSVFPDLHAMQRSRLS